MSRNPFPRPVVRLRYVVSRHGAIGLLFAVALLTRLPLLSSSLNEVDAANFVNALINGYDIPLFRPHAPGYPVYIFLGWLFNGLIHDPLLSLTLVSALLGSLAVIPFYLLVREIVGARIAIVGTLLFILNPLYWSFSEAALSDVPAAAAVVLLAWLCYKARYSSFAFLWACVVSSIAIGIRQPNVAVLLLLAFPVGYWLLVLRVARWKLLSAGVALFCIATVAWAVPMVLLGTEGPSDYRDAVSWQWSVAASGSDIRHVDPPWIVNALYRAERFLTGYFLTHSWAGGDAKTPATLLLVMPWVFGFGLFITGFRFKNPGHLFVALWVITISYIVLAIHFLPRYGLAQTPGFMIGCLMGYGFLGSTVLRHARRLEILTLLVGGCILILYGIKYQSPVNTFESSPPDGGFYPSAFFAGGLLLFLLAKLIYARSGQRLHLAEERRSSIFGKTVATYHTLIMAVLMLLAVPFLLKGYNLASIAHNEPSPNQQLVEFVSTNFDTSRIIPCWDDQTHSFFETLLPVAEPRRFSSVRDIYLAHEAGNTLLITDRCIWYDEIDRAIGLSEVGRFAGDSPLWSKAPLIILYAANTSSQDSP